MRNAFNAALERDDYDASRLGSSVGLDEDLQNIASLRAGTHHRRTGAVPTLVTPAEAAVALRVSVSTIYRAVRSGELREERVTKRHGPLRIPTSELESFAERRSRVRMQEGNGEHVLADPPADSTLSECFASTHAS